MLINFNSIFGKEKNEYSNYTNDKCFRNVRFTDYAF